MQYRWEEIDECLKRATSLLEDYHLSSRLSSAHDALKQINDRVRGPLADGESVEAFNGLWEVSGASALPALFWYEMAKIVRMLST